MAKIITGQLRTVPGVYYTVAQKSRVVSAVISHKASPDIQFAVSEAIANPFRVLRVKVWLLWLSYTDPPSHDFRVTTGVGKDVDQAVVHDWEDIVPLRWENVRAHFRTTPQYYEFDWTMRREFAGQGRRLGFWSSANNNIALLEVYFSVEIEEG